MARDLTNQMPGFTTAEAHRVEYNWIQGVEKLEDYRLGGYHPIMIGCMLHDRYKIVDKLGHGGYSTVWLAYDTNVKQYVALKVNIADAHPREAKAFRALSQPLLDNTRIHESPSTSLPSPPIHPGRDRGPNGTHACYTVAPAECNLREISFSRLFPLDVARALSLRRCYVHGDIHLRNILIKPPSSLDDLSIERFYKKYGEPETVSITRCNGDPLPPYIPTKAVIPILLGKYAEKFTLRDTRLGKDCHTPQALRAPEAMFRPNSPLTFASDIWSLATAIWEIMGMKALFSTDFVPEDDIVAQQVDVLGMMPSEWWVRWEGRGRFFDAERRPTETYSENRWPDLEGSFDDGIQRWRRRWGGEIEKDEKRVFLDLIRRMLMFKPEERLTVEEVLNSEWMVKWALPDYQQSLELCSRPMERHAD
ncbi:kinase-like protein [Aspergillus ellipticus CBS 707.79]|uniref:non-specific serine/threonine protein kinase n=1 Tax=Aspergillus ellipticus CBS 707.79 TaxID=1448320 RepID=A0A319DIA6_9EURO|nr:kinase-like protein [Aspergillus ellipticus CBS 707.79]